MDEASIREFWDRAATRNPYWYVSSYGPYSPDRNLEEFWRSGGDIWRELKTASGYAPTPEDFVIEIGCGVGRLTRAIAPEVGRVVALDISPEMLALAQQADLPNVEFRTAVGFTLPGIPDRSVDLVLAYNVFQHLPSLAALRCYIVEMTRVARPGGLVAFTLPLREWRDYLMPALRLRAWIRNKLGRGAPEVYRKEWVGIRPSERQIRALCPAGLQRKALDASRILYFFRAP